MAAQNKVLIVEDDSITRTLLTEMLKRLGVELLTAEDGQEALEVVKKNKVNLVLMDIGMPRMDGMEALVRMRKIAPFVPIIIISVWKDMEYQRIANENNVFHYIQKPFNLQELLSAVNRALRQHPDPGAPAIAGSKNAFKLKAKRIVFPILLISTFAVLAFVMNQSKSSLPMSPSLPSAFSLPYSNPTGISWNGKHLLLIDWSTQSICQHEVDYSLSLVKFYKQTDYFPVSIAWGNKK